MHPSRRIIVVQLRSYLENNCRTGTTYTIREYDKHLIIVFRYFHIEIAIETIHTLVKLFVVPMYEKRT